MNPNILRTKYFARTQGYETLWVIEQSLAHHIYSIKLLSSMFQFLHSMHLIIVHATMLQQFTVELRFFCHFSMHFILWPDWSLDFGPWASNYGLWPSDNGLRSLDLELRTSDYGLRTLDFGIWSLDCWWFYEVHSSCLILLAFLVVLIKYWSCHYT